MEDLANSEKGKLIKTHSIKQKLAVGDETTIIVNERNVDKYIYKGNMSLIKKIVYKVVSRMPIPFILNLVVLR